LVVNTVRYWQQLTQFMVHCLVFIFQKEICL
jgi:hypothetical protein